MVLDLLATYVKWEKISVILFMICLTTMKRLLTPRKRRKIQVQLQQVSQKKNLLMSRKMTFQMKSQINLCLKTILMKSQINLYLKTILMTSQINLCLKMAKEKTHLHSQITLLTKGRVEMMKKRVRLLVIPIATSTGAQMDKLAVKTHLVTDLVINLIRSQTGGLMESIVKHNLQ